MLHNCRSCINRSSLQQLWVDSRPALTTVCLLHILAGSPGITADVTSEHWTAWWGMVLSVSCSLSPLAESTKGQSLGFQRRWGEGLLLFSHSVVSDSLQPHGLQHARLPRPSLSPGVCSNSWTVWNGEKGWLLNKCFLRVEGRRGGLTGNKSSCPLLCTFSSWDPWEAWLPCWVSAGSTGASTVPRTTSQQRKPFCSGAWTLLSLLN